MNRNNQLRRQRVVFCLLMSLVLLSACTGWSPDQPDPVEVETKVREPAREDAAGVQVYPLKNPAVQELMDEASAAEAKADYSQASLLLERALRIQPRDPELLQHMAEVQLQIRDYEQALNFAVRSYDLGPRVGEICSRNWRTISVSREHLGDHPGAVEAEERARTCMVTKPQGF